MTASFTKTVFPNGLRLVLAPRKGSLASTVLVLVEAGSEYETKKKNGISHFLEHLMFKGTTNRPEPGAISSELDALGAEYNAFTGQEYTGYWAKAQSHKLTHILDIVCDLYLNPIFNPEEIEKERGVVIEEINMYEDTPMRRVQELFSSLLYGDQPAGWDIAGEKAVIRRLAREDFLAYRNARYLPNSTIVTVVGDFKPAAITATVKKLFSRLPRKMKAAKQKTIEWQRKPGTLVKFKASDQSHIVLGTRAFPIFDKRRHALQVLADVLGGGMSSRLFRRVREELGAAYYVRASTDLFADHGFLAVSAGADLARTEKVIAVILEELNRLRNELVGAGELQKAKDHMIGTFTLGLETSDELASFYGGQEIITKKIVEPDGVAAKVRKVTAEEIRQVARAIFRNDRLNLAVIGPYKDGKKFERILKL